MLIALVRIAPKPGGATQSHPHRAMVNMLRGPFFSLCILLIAIFIQVNAQFVHPRQQEVLLEILIQLPSLGSNLPYGHWTNTSIANACTQNALYGVKKCDANGWISEIEWDAGYRGSMPRAMGNMTGLRTLITHDTFRGPFEPAWSGMTKLTVLKINNGQGSIPTSWSALSNMEEFSLQGYDQIPVPFPSWLTTSWIKLKSLKWSNLRTSDPCPDLSILPLEEIDLSNNKFTGSVPIGIFSMNTLKILKLSVNELSGEIPSLSNLNNEAFSTLELFSNRFEGNLPPHLPPSVENANFGGNSFVGSIPSAWFNLPRLFYLSASANQLSGPLPANWSGMPSLLSLSLSDNQFSGTVPSQLMHPSESGVNLMNLRLSNNRLTLCSPGQIPTSSSLSCYVVNQSPLECGCPEIWTCQSTQMPSKCPIAPVEAPQEKVRPTPITNTPTGTSERVNPNQPSSFTKYWWIILIAAFVVIPGAIGIVSYFLRRRIPAVPSTSLGTHAG